MKKTAKKLHFSKESVRSLNPVDLTNVGGASGGGCNPPQTTRISCGGSCEEATCYCA